MSISFGSINTGLPKDIVAQLMKAERMPITQMETRKGKIVDKKNLVQELEKKVTELRDLVINNQDTKSLRELKVTTNSDFVNVTLDKNLAQPGIYQFEVGQLAQKSSAMTSAVEDKDKTYLGVGFIKYFLPNGEAKEIYIDADNSNLTSISNMINRDPSLGLTSTVVNDGSGEDNAWRMILSLRDTGDDNLAEFPYFYFVDGEEDLYLEKERPAHDAKVTIDGFEIQKKENNLKDLIPGATVELKKAKPGEEFSISITEDKEAITLKVKDIVDKINAVLTFIKEQNSMDDKTDTTRTLGGESLLQTLESRIRGALFKTVNTKSGPRRVGDIGITFQRTGLLQFDSKVFESAVAKDFQTVADVLTGAVDSNGIKYEGFISTVFQTANLALRTPDGVISSRKRTFGDRIEDIDRRIEDKERMLSQKEKSLKDKFSRLESTMSQIRNQGAGIASLGQDVPPVQQLG
ncbi:MAG: hypothetical protein A2202_06180 [Bdellovibrionales bacterium RIFOXYA1_FULL_36_14]|nr:MAG: hypothetical protein A2202_06180 [Bdellovibrionales bacterium RIFOXYA1_FULL_36_14]